MAPYASTIIRKPNQPKISPSLTRKESFTTTSPYKLKRLQMQNKEQELQNQQQQARASPQLENNDSVTLPLIRLIQMEANESSDDGSKEHSFEKARESIKARQQFLTQPCRSALKKSEEEDGDFNQMNVPRPSLEPKEVKKVDIAEEEKKPVNTIKKQTTTKMRQPTKFNGGVSSSGRGSTLGPSAPSSSSKVKTKRQQGKDIFRHCLKRGQF